MLSELNMNESAIQKIGKKELGGIPQSITRMTIGICNEVYELKYPSASYILRMNKEKEWLYGTHKFLPLFKKLKIKTPAILVEDYTKTHFPFCYQIQTKIEGQDLGVVMSQLSRAELSLIAEEISEIFDKFKALPDAEGFGSLTGLREEQYDSLLQVLEKRRSNILERNKNSQVIDEEIMGIYDQLLEDYRDYFLHLKPKLYYDDICSKNVMIHNGQFTGLVDLDFLMKGDYLEPIGTMLASWYGEELGEFYVNEIMRLQNLNEFQQQVVKVYATLNLILWLSEEGIQFNSNSSSVINWGRVEEKKRKIQGLYQSLKTQ